MTGMVQRDGALRIAEQGGFRVGVTRASRAYGTAAADQMYVGYQIPAERRHALPLVLVHPTPRRCSWRSAQRRGRA